VRPGPGERLAPLDRVEHVAGPASSRRCPRARRGSTGSVDGSPAASKVLISFVKTRRSRPLTPRLKLMVGSEMLASPLRFAAGHDLERYETAVLEAGDGGRNLGCLDGPLEDLPFAVSGSVLELCHGGPSVDRRHFRQEIRRSKSNQVSRRTGRVGRREVFGPALPLGQEPTPLRLVLAAGLGGDGRRGIRGDCRCPGRERARSRPRGSESSGSRPAHPRGS
jgi:hypothetical protein